MNTILDQYLAAAVKEICSRPHRPRHRDDEHMRSYPGGSRWNSYDHISLEDEYGQ